MKHFVLTLALILCIALLASASLPNLIAGGIALAAGIAIYLFRNASRFRVPRG